MNRVVLYSPAGASLSDVLSLQHRVESLGISITEYSIGCLWPEVLLGLEPGDELVVGSLDCFTSLNELLGFVATRGVRVHSLNEAWLSAPIEEPLDYLRCLYELGSSLHATRTRTGLDRAALAGRHPGRKPKAKGKGLVEVKK